MRFATVTLSIAGLTAGGIFVDAKLAGAAVLAITVLAFFIDKLAAAAAAAPDDPGQAFPAGTRLSITLGVIQVPILLGAVHALSRDAATPADKALIFLAVSLFLGQIGNANAHELIHRPARFARWLGAVAYASILYGHHASAHLRVHHRVAATPDDPNTARLGESFYAYAIRAWVGSFRAGFAEEARLRAGKAGPHPYWGYAAVSLLSMGAAFGLGGWPGVLWLLGIALYAQAQLLLSDYVQHYGLFRTRRPQGGWVPMGPEHSWNAPHGFSSAMMLNAPRHSDHHTRPGRAYPGLALDRGRMPMLPHSLPVMAVLALVPPIWRRVMDRRARRWTAPPSPLGSGSVAAE